MGRGPVKAPVASINALIKELVKVTWTPPMMPLTDKAQNTLQDYPTTDGTRPAFGIIWRATV